MRIGDLKPGCLASLGASSLPDPLSGLVAASRVGNLAAYEHVSSQAAAPLMETAMDDKKSDARTIAAEEVGEARGCHPRRREGQASDRGGYPATCDLGWTTGRHCDEERRVGWREDRRCVRHDGRGESGVAESCSNNRVSDQPCGATAVCNGRRGLCPRLCRRGVDSPPSVTGEGGGGKDWATASVGAPPDYFGSTVLRRPRWSARLRAVVNFAGGCVPT